LARACAAAGITFVGPAPELLDQMGDKTAARKLAARFGIPTLPGTAEPVSDPDEALRIGHEIGFPLILKAAFGGGGRGMRVAEKSSQLLTLLEEARGEAGKSFGNPAVFLERYIGRARHVEVQVLGDRHGNVVHLHERDCSVQRRYQKVVEVAPAVGFDPAIREAICAAAVKLASGIGYDNAGTVEFLVDMDRGDWFFIEMNPRIQVEHTVTECVTGIDLVRSQILIAQGRSLHDDEVGIPEQDKIPCNGYAIQCRITTEDPEKNFVPDYGRITTYRSAAGFGVRLDAGAGDAGSVITPYYDSLLVKLTTMGRSFGIACQRMDRALREFRIRGVKTNIPFLENVIEHPVFRAGEAYTKLIDSEPALFEFTPRRDRATKTLAYLSDVTINGNPTTKGWKPDHILPPAPVPPAGRGAEGGRNRNQPPAGTRDLLLEKGPDGFVQWILAEERLLVTDTTMRDAHQSLMATRMRTIDMLRVAPVIARRLPGLFSLEMWGGATFDTAMRFLRECPWDRLRKLREQVPNILFQMLFRGSNAVGYSNYPDNVVAGFVHHAADSGIDLFRIFDSLNYLPNMQVAIEAVRGHGKVLCEAAICYTGDIDDPKRDKYSLAYYVRKAKELERMGAHILAIKDMAGLCKPFAARRLVATLKQEIALPIHFHTHATAGTSASSVLNAADAGVDIVDLAIASMSGSTSQPNLNSVVAAMHDQPRDTGLDLGILNRLSDYWEEVMGFYKPFDTAPRAGTAEVYEHEMPGGQYTNLREQAAAMGLGHQWPEIARTYAEVNQLFGDIVKVTPSSKVVGDMAMFLITRGIAPADVPRIKPGSLDWPESVIDMLAGGLGQPDGGWPAELQKIILGDRRPTTKRPGELAEPVDLGAARAGLTIKLGRPATDDDLYSHLMYPQVFAEFEEFRSTYDDLGGLPTPAFFYGLKVGEEIEFDFEPGKRLIIRLVSLTPADAEGRHTLFYELNGMPREVTMIERALAREVARRPKAAPGNPCQLGAPMPGAVTEVAVAPGQQLIAGEKVVVLEAMKMLTTVSAPADAIVREVHVKRGDTVETDDLLVEFEPV
jgi:pyruvate carboxylase